MKLSKSLLAVLIAAIAGVGFVSSTQATSITGLLNISGNVTFNTSSLATATQVTSFDSVVTGALNTGSFASIAQGTSVNMAGPLIFLPLPGVANSTLWSVGSFTFDMEKVTFVSRTSHAIEIDATGTILGPGSGPGSPFDDTPGVFVLTAQDPTGGNTGMQHLQITFSAGTSAQPVPDGGMTISLLGLGLIGVGFLRAKFVKA